MHGTYSAYMVYQKLWYQIEAHNLLQNSGRACPHSLQQAGSPLLYRGKKLVTLWKNIHHSKAARMHPNVNLPDPLISFNDPLDSPVFSAFNCFSVLPEECLFSLTLSPILSSSHKRFRYCLYS